MNHCKKCGNEFEDGTIFCPVCGEPVNSRSEANNNTPIESGVNFNNSSPAHNFGYLLKGMLYKPIATIQEVYYDTKPGLSVFILILSGIIFGLLNDLVVKVSLHRLSSKISSIYGSSISASAVLSNYTMSISYAKIFLKSSLILIAIIVIIFVITTACIKIFYKSVSTDTGDLLSITAISSIPFIYGYILFSAINFIYFPVAIIFLFIGLVYSFTCLYRGFCDELDTSEDAVLFFVILAFIVTCIIFYFVSKHFQINLFSVFNIFSLIN